MAEDNQTDADGQQEPGQHAPTTKDVNDAKPKTFTHHQRTPRQGTRQEKRL